MTPCPFCHTDNYVASSPPQGAFRAAYGCTRCSAFVMADSIDTAMEIWKSQIPTANERVREFHQAFGHPIALAPTGGDKALRELRVRLIAEELGELCEALGVDLELKTGPWYAATETTECKAACVVDELDEYSAADALGDLAYVVQGANLAFGFPAEAVFAEIHRSNMSKLGANGEPLYRADGKVLKGPNYSPPNIAAIFKKLE